MIEITHIEYDDAEARLGAELIQASARACVAPLPLREALSRPPQRQRAGAGLLGWRRLVAAGGLAAVAAAVAISLAPDGAPSLDAVATAAVAVTPDAPAREPLRASGVRLPAHVEGWTADARGRASVGGRSVDVVAYRTATGAEVRYAVVDGEPLSVHGGRAQGAFRVLTLDGHRAVTWRRGGHTCVLTVAHGDVPVSGLLDAAAAAA
jgi:hypothetical protein